jgi:DNA-binding MarR family transcriptional regulator
MSNPTRSAELAVLARLQTRGPLGSTCGALAQWRGCTRQCMYAVLRRLEQRGLVTRRWSGPYVSRRTPRFRSP